MLKRKAHDEFKIIVLKQRIFPKMVRALHSCNTTVWALRSVQCHGKAISTRLSHCLRVDFKICEKLACSYESMCVMNTKRNFQTIIKLCYYSKMLNKHNTLLNYFRTKTKKKHSVSVINLYFLWNSLKERVTKLLHLSDLGLFNE
jgi:hypothetical protein